MFQPPVFKARSSDDVEQLFMDLTRTLCTVEHGVDSCPAGGFLILRVGECYVLLKRHNEPNDHEAFFYSASTLAEAQRGAKCSIKDGSTLRRLLWISAVRGTSNESGWQTYFDQVEVSNSLQVLLEVQRRLAL